MQRYRLDISYDGTDYAGWQIQPNGVTVQEIIQKALTQLTGEDVKLHGSGRTDQGVHARRQVAHTDIVKPWEPGKLATALNAVLPGDIRITRAAKVDATFHARRSVRIKEYRYFIWNGEILPPVKRRYTTHVKRSLDVEAMNRAARILVGRHDFTAFSANPKRHVESHIRRVDRLEVRKHGADITIIAAGEGFLYKMVRSMAGFLIRVGEGAVAPSVAKEILASGIRTARVPTAPPEGLFLWNVTY